VNIREAILRAADALEANPSLFKYHATRVPECGSPGCLVGLIACFAGYAPGTRVFAVTSGDEPEAVKKWALPGHGALWERIHSLVNFRGALSATPPHLLVEAMRLYADKYHPAEAPKPRGIPDSVRAIFTQTEPANV